jgi:hypothetical protein
MTQKMARPISPEQAYNIVRKYVLVWQVHTNTPDTIRLAVKIQRQYKIVFLGCLDHSRCDSV